MLIMLGASASGKTEIGKVIIQKYGLKMITYTTRKRLGANGRCRLLLFNKRRFLAKKVIIFLLKQRFIIIIIRTAFKDASDDKVLIVVEWC